MRVLVVNAGSSSIKVAVVEDGERVESHDDLPQHAPEVDAVGHRIVHGGPDLVAPTVIDADVERRLRELVALAPLHQPKSLRGLDEARRLLPDVPHVACFDTAFHATLPRAAHTYALPREWRERWGVRRYGFHGLSHAWAARRALEFAPGATRVVTCHLGAGASLAAVLDGRSVDTTMGFTPLEGLVMATRSGSVDPGLLTWIEEHEGLSPHEVAHDLEHRSGLLGLAGTADMRDVLARRDEDARLALDVYLHRLACGVAAMTVGLGGLDALVFTGGVGERAAEVRRRACAALGYLGVRVDERRNADARPDSEISAADAAVRTFVVEAREDLEIAACVERVLAA
ncbi:acetate/propionate family kinase [Solihabitans fulvus]|uniref:Acetate kinase n=1 Tax=Solihabitans fulvus TaxID=1892852 RepID=A0A5B2WWU5_9PSEU|nr:acetate/propionate family kinase [Solihabitans fulvus]KAA2255975.1 acetate/propionate family kinase [Solihabitans fulvus]